jgi:hypothetical protein
MPCDRQGANNNFAEEKNTRNFVPYYLAKEKNSENWFCTIQGQKNHLDDFRKTFFAELCSVSSRISERAIPNTQNSTKGALFSTE